MAPLERAVHEALWLAGYLRLRRGGRSYAFPAASTRHVTTIVRVPAEVGAAIEPVLRRLHRLDPSHHFYTPDTLHVTVANLDHVAAPLEEVSAAVAPHRPLELEARGLNMSPSTVFVRVRCLEAALRELRRDLRALPQGSAGLSGARSRRILGVIAFANVVRFAGPVSRPFLAEVARAAAALRPLDGVRGRARRDRSPALGGRHPWARTHLADRARIGSTAWCRQSSSTSARRSSTRPACGERSPTRWACHG